MPPPTGRSARAAQLPAELTGPVGVGLRMRGAIAAGHELTARAGAEALAQGGNAVDAVVAAGGDVVGGGAGADGPVRRRLRAGAPGPRPAPPCSTPSPRSRASTCPTTADWARSSRSRCRSTSVRPRCSTSARPPVPCPGWCPACTPCTAATAGCPGGELLIPAAAAADRGVAVNAGPARGVQGDRGDRHRHTRGAGRCSSGTAHYVREGDVRAPARPGRLDRAAGRAGPASSPRGELARAMVDHQQATGGSLTMDDLAA